jgi:hypothetical protein
VAVVATISAVVGAVAATVAVMFIIRRHRQQQPQKFLNMDKAHEGLSSIILAVSRRLTSCSMGQFAVQGLELRYTGMQAHV